MSSIFRRDSQSIPLECSQSISSSSASSTEEENLDPDETLPFRDNYALRPVMPAPAFSNIKRIESFECARSEADCKPRSHSAPEYLHNPDKISNADKGRVRLQRMKNLADNRCLQNIKKTLALPKEGPEIQFSLLLKDPLTKQTFYDLFVNNEKHGKPLPLAVVKYRNIKQYSFFYGEQFKYLIENIPSSNFLKKMKSIYWFSLKSLNDPSFAFTGKTGRPRIFQAVLNRKKSFIVF